MERKRLRPKATESLANKYRPQTWDEVLGQDWAVASLRTVLDDGGQRSFLLVGPSGLGKTSIARLIPKHLGCDDRGSPCYKETDPANTNRVKEIRAIIDWMRYFPSTRDGKKTACIDEAQSLSPEAWQSLLKATESPPVYGYYVICTTDPSKVPPSMKTRCAWYDLRPVSTDLILALLGRIAKAESLKLEWAALCKIAEGAAGSPRQAFTFLEQCRRLRTVRRSCGNFAVLVMESQSGYEILF